MPETYKAAGMVPKDILMLDELHGYGPETELGLTKNGFKVIFGNFLIHGNIIADWDVRSTRENVLGAEVSTWCSADEYTLGRNNIIYGLVFASGILWWDGYKDRLWERERMRVIEIMPTIREMLKGIGHLPVGFDNSRYELYLAGKCTDGQDVMVLPRNARWVKGNKLPLVFKDISRFVGVPASKENINLDICTGIKSLVFLHAAIKPMEYVPSWTFSDMSEYLLGKYEIVFEDGSVDSIEIRYGINIGCIDMDWGRCGSKGDGGLVPETYDSTGTADGIRMKVPYYTSLDRWTGSLIYSSIPVYIDTSEGTKTLFAFEWINPEPSREIKAIRIVNACEDPDQKLLIFAVAGAKH